MANKDSNFKESLKMSDVLLPDGVAVVVATRLLTGQKIKKIAGADLHSHLLKELNQSGGSCFYLGSSESTLAKIKDKMAIEYPNIRVGVFSPPFKKEFTDDDNATMINAINEFKPDALFIGMTAPKQEKWAFANKDKINTKIICTIGAVFDFYAGTVKRPNKIWIQLGMEWMGRLINEPMRLWKRYLYFGPIFVGMIIKQKLKLNHDKHMARTILLKPYQSAA